MVTVRNETEMAMTDHSPEARPGSDTVADEPVGVDEAGRSNRWMTLAMVACCAALPLAFLIVALAGGFALSSVSPWALALLGVAIVAAGAMIVRVAGVSR